MLQATVGVASTMAGAIISLIVANLAYKLARSSLAISKATLLVSHKDSCREIEKDAKTLRIKLVRFQSDFEEAMTDLLDASGKIYNKQIYLYLFASRYVVRGDNLKRAAYSPPDGGQHGGLDAFIPGEFEAARALLEDLNKARLRAIQEEIAEQFSPDDAAKLMTCQKGPFSDALAALGAGANTTASAGATDHIGLLHLGIQTDLSALEDSFRRLQRVTAQIYDDVDLSGLVESIEGVSDAANVLRKMCKKIDTKVVSDGWLDAIAIARVCSDFNRRIFCGGTAEEEEHYFLDKKARELLFAFSLLNNLTQPEEYCHNLYFWPVWSSDSLKATERFTRILSATTDEILKEYELVLEVDGSDPYKPLQFRRYKPRAAVTRLQNASTFAVKIFDEWKHRTIEKHGVCYGETDPAHFDHFGVYDAQTALMRKYAMKILDVRALEADVRVATPPF
ncbi:hypothetical protein CKO20_10345 [Rhodocyclus tenuis]|nr:hypothetical protein [Rhodocyclus tenuis]